MKGLLVKGLSKIYKGKEDTYALKETSFHYGENQIIGLLGDNGAGKTTLLKSIIDIVHPTTGSISLNGQDLRSMTCYDKTQSVFFVAEGTRSLWWRLTVKENIKFICQMKWGNWHKVKNGFDGYLKIFKLLEKKDTLVGELSRGQQQKVCLLLAVVAESPLIIMDEPTLGLDVSSRQEIADMILAAKEKSKKKIFIISSHDMAFVAKVADRVSVLKDGHLIADGTIKDLKKLLDTNYISFELTDILSDTQIKKLKKDFSVETIRVNSGKCTFDIADDESKKNSIIDYLRSESVNIASIKARSGDLESLFAELQGGEYESTRGF